MFSSISQAADVDVKFIDALFTSASAVCVTGLTTVTTATTWNIVGKTVILCLIQIGGLSLITILNILYRSSRKENNIEGSPDCAGDV